MSETNPYAPTTSTVLDDSGIQQIQVRPIEVMKRAYRLVGDQYWLFLGITLVGILIGSAVPFGLILGPMLVGIYLCYLGREQGQRVEFGTLFKGFEQFKDSFIAMLMLIALSMVVMIPFMIAMVAMVILPMAAQGNQGNGPPVMPSISTATIFVLYPLMIIANMVIAIPFLFTFQLIADRKLTAVAAVKTSLRGVLKNLGGVIWFFFVLMVVSTVLTMMCYVPGILFFPISFGSMFVLYRDIFPRGDMPAATQVPGTF